MDSIICHNPSWHSYRRGRHNPSGIGRSWGNSSFRYRRRQSLQGLLSEKQRTVSQTKIRRTLANMVILKFLVWLLTVPILSGKKRGRIRALTMSYLRSISVRRRAKKVGNKFYCGGRVHITRKTEIGDYVSIQSVWASGNGRLVFGNHTWVGDGLRIFTRSHNFKGEEIPFDKTYITKDVIIDDFVWIGSQVILLPGTHIGEGAVIQAGSVVHGYIPPFAIAGGNPCVPFSQRNRKQFDFLKSNGKINRASLC